MIRSARGWLLALALAGGCAEPAPLCPVEAAAHDKANPADRRLLGEASAYPADPSLRERAALLHSSQRARREAAWQVVARVVAPVPLSEAAGPLAGQRVPRFRTWLDRDDARRVFQRAYEALGPEGRRARAPLGDALLDEALAANLRALEEAPDYDPKAWAAYLGALDEPEALAGVGGIRRLAINGPGLRHLLGSYAEVLGCVAQGAPPAQLGVDAPPCAAAPLPSPACLRGPFPDDTVSVAEHWVRLDPGEALPTYDTSAEALRTHLDEPSPSWGEGDWEAVPGEGEIYSLTLPSGARYALAGLHVRTRELDRYVSLTLWYSERPNEDFGADRPASLPAPWGHYKMCVVVGLTEQDPAPDGGLEGSLGEALEAQYQGVGGPSLCSNPYIDQGPGLARSGCVGCHQHAMSGLRPGDTLDAPERDNYPADQYWGLDAGDDLAALFAETEAWWRAAGRPLNW